MLFKADPPVIGELPVSYTDLELIGQRAIFILVQLHFDFSESPRSWLSDMSKTQTFISEWIAANAVENATMRTQASIAFGNEDDAVLFSMRFCDWTEIK